MIFLLFQRLKQPLKRFFIPHNLGKLNRQRSTKHTSIFSALQLLNPTFIKTAFFLSHTSFALLLGSNRNRRSDSLTFLNVSKLNVRGLPVDVDVAVDDVVAAESIISTVALLVAVLQTSALINRPHLGQNRNALSKRQPQWL